MEAISLVNQGVKQAAEDRRAASWQLLPVFSLDLHLPQDADRAPTQRFIHQRFLQQYGARISTYLPYLLSARDENQITAALGFQIAENNTLFLEQYLDCDIETALSLLTQTPIARNGIVEIGNLASGRQRATQTLFLLLAQILHGAGYEWVVFTANTAVKQWMERLDMPTFVIREADPTRLPDKGEQWGSYYDDRPVVLAANIEHSFSRMNMHPLMTHLRDSYAQQINQFKAMLSV